MMRAGLVLAAIALAACSPKGGAGADEEVKGGAVVAGGEAKAPFPLTIRSANGAHAFTIEPARTAAAQEQGLMYRTELKPDGGMLFWPYPPDGGAPRVATFWMKNTPTPLDIVFIRADGTIAHIAENAVPFSEAMIPSGEPAAAVLELVGGRTAELGIAEGDRVVWPGGPAH